MSTKFPSREEPKITWYQVALWCTIVLAVIGDIIIGYALWKVGIPLFLRLWVETTLKWSVVAFLCGVVWYKLWIDTIEKNEKYQAVPEFMDKAYREASFKPYGAAMCPKCETMMYYRVTEPWQKDNAILTCPQCGHKFSFVWCEKCGMGGDFVQIEEKPDSWECPDCHTIYPLPPAIWEYPFETFLEDKLPHSTQLANLYLKKQNERKAAFSTVWIFAGYGFLLTLAEPLQRVFDIAFPPSGSGVASGPMIFMYLCLGMAVLMGFMLLPSGALWLWFTFRKKILQAEE